MFIDTNILLSFYHFASDDLDELQKLLDLIKKGIIVLTLPEQVKQEFWRNREAKIADAMSRLRGQKLNLEFPQICKDSVLFPVIRSAQKEYDNNHRLLILELTKAANSRQLKADKVIEELFCVATLYPMPAKLISEAQLRISLGNPPGKNGSLGDAINWQTLLTKVPSGEDLYFISGDKDFRSPIDDSRFSQFLTGEWTEKKSSNLFYYNSLSRFFSTHYPNIKLATEKEIDKLTNELATSGSFAYTHSIIAKFSQHIEYSDDQVNLIIDAILSNNQVYWILDDEDVNRFVHQLIDDRETVIDNAKLTRLKELLQKIPENIEATPYDSDEIPF